MAMSKKEQQSFDQLQQQLCIAKALRFTDPVTPDVKPPESGVVYGFLASQLAFHPEPEVTSHYTTQSTHGRAEIVGNEVRRSPGVSGTQGSQALFGTRIAALRALRNKVEQESGERLAMIDRAIEQELAR